MKLNEFLTEGKEESFDKTLWTFLTTHYAPNDKVVHKLAEDLGIEPDKLETAIYKLFTSFTTKGKSKGKILDVDREQLAKGIKVETEHTTDLKISEKIARDHLAEIPDYYTRLEAMEKQAEKEGAKH